MRYRTRTCMVLNLSTNNINTIKPSLRRRSVSESDTDPMASSSDTPLYRNNIISVGRAVSQPNVFGLGLINSIDEIYVLVVWVELVSSL